MPTAVAERAAVREYAGRHRRPDPADPAIRSVGEGSTTHINYGLTPAAGLPLPRRAAGVALRVESQTPPPMPPWTQQLMVSAFLSSAIGGAR